MAIPPKKSKIKKPQKNITTQTEKLEGNYILIEPDRPDIWQKGGFRLEYSLGKKKIYEKFIINKMGKLEFVTNKPTYSKFKPKNQIVFVPKDKINLHTLYHAEGECEFYSASFFGGEIHTQLIPLNHLPDFLEKQITIDNDEGKFYDLITLRENGRLAWGEKEGFNINIASSGFQHTKESAEELLLNLTEYKRKGALIDEGGTFEYIQVCYIILG